MEPPKPRYELLARSYPELVLKGRDARLFQMLDEDEIPEVESLQVVSGGPLRLPRTSRKTG